jgi:hypothetical protein
MRPRFHQIPSRAGASSRPGSSICCCAGLRGSSHLSSRSRCHIIFALPLVTAPRTTRVGPRSAYRSSSCTARCLREVVAEVVLVSMLLVCSDMLLNGFLRLHRVDPGFDSHNALTLRIGVACDPLLTTDAGRAFLTTKASTSTQSACDSSNQSYLAKLCPIQLTIHCCAFICGDTIYGDTRYAR